MRADRLRYAAAATGVACAIALHSGSSAAASAGDAVSASSALVVGRVAPEVGLIVGADGRPCGRTGTLPVRVTRRRYGDVVVTTVL